MMSDFLAAFFIGLAGSVHCVSMCGGVTAGLSMAAPKNSNKLPYIASYNIGRALSYTLAGAITGALSSILSHQLNNGIAWLHLISGIFLLLVAAYIGNWWPILTHLEKAGSVIWRFISPLSKKLIPFSTPIHALPYGFIWGWLPCGLVYSALTWSLASQNALNGAVIMLCFGLGTLPSMILTAYSTTQLTALLKNPQTKQIMAILICIFALFSISKSLPNIL